MIEFATNSTHQLPKQTVEEPDISSEAYHLARKLILYFDELEETEQGCVVIFIRVIPLGPFPNPKQTLQEPDISSKAYHLVRKLILYFDEREEIEQGWLIFTSSSPLQLSGTPNKPVMS